MKVYQDVNNNGAIDAGDTVVGTQQLATGATAFNISAPLTQDAVNTFVVTATDAAGNRSAPTDVPTVTEDSAAPTGLVVTSPSAPTTVDAVTFAVTGTAEAGSLVQIFRDVNNNGAIDAGDGVVGMQQLAGGATNFSINVPLAHEAANNFLVTATDAVGNQGNPVDVPTITEAAPVVAPPSPTPPVSTAASSQIIVLGTNAGVPATVRVLDAVTRAVLRDIVPFGGFAGGVRVAVGGVTGDGRDDVIVGTATASSHVKVYDGASGAEVRSFFAFDGYFGGVTLAAGDVNGDGRSDAVVGTATQSSHVKAFSGVDGAVLKSFIAFPGFGNGVKVAAGDVTGDGRADVAAVAGPGGNGHVKVFDGVTDRLVTSFLGYVGYNEEINLAVGDVTRDGRADVVATAQNSTRGTHVKAFDAAGVEVASFFAPVSFAPAAIGPNAGVRRDDQFPVSSGPAGPAWVAAADVTGDRVVDYLLGSPPGAGTSRLVVVNGATGAATNDQIAFDPLFGFGVFVGVK